MENIIQAIKPQSIMKVCVFMFSLLLSINVFGGTRDTTQKKLPMRRVSHTPQIQNKVAKPLIILDGKVYKGNLTKLDPKDIMTVDILKGKDAVPIYGSKAAYGIILIKTKKYAQQQRSTLIGTRDTIHKDTSTKWTIRVNQSIANPIDKPLILVNDTIYKGNIDSIDPKTIESIDIHKDKRTTSIYGSQAASGVIIIKTKSYTKSKVNPLDSLVNKDALYVVDGEPSKNKLNGVDPNDILSIDILKKEQRTDASLQPLTDIVMVVTKSAVIKAYQTKFSTFSKDYKEYIDRNNGNDSSCDYIINLEPLNKEQKDFIKKLYQIPVGKIQSVEVQYARPVDSFIRPKILITTKNKR